MARVRQVYGRLKSERRCSSKLVHRFYPWPAAPSATTHAAVGESAHGAAYKQTARARRTIAELADLYHPLAMPRALRDAHRALDRAVDKCYRSAAFDSDRQRVEYLFGLYQRLTSLFAANAAGARGGRTRGGSRRTRSAGSAES